MKRINKTLLELYNDRKQILVVSCLFYMAYLLNDLVPGNPYITYATGVIIGAVGVGIAAVGVGMSAYSGAKSRKMAESQAKDAAIEKQREKAELDKQKEVWRSMKFENPYQENVYEDLTINQQQAQFEVQQGAQQRANIMGQMRGAAGGSGIAALAQQMASQGQLATQRASASIGQQEAANQRLRAQGAQQRQAGEAQKQQFELDKQRQLLALESGESTAAIAASQQAQRDIVQTHESTTQATSQGVIGLGGSVASMGFGMMKPTGGTGGADGKLSKEQKGQLWDMKREARQHQDAADAYSDMSGVTKLF